ncbi:MAG TPA: hypothetical protein G4O17_04870 [Dehalococcoidia bacterium]|jgi:hypothetical protein|nr:hypothetical protein [Dehalococcoidia bacterium]
MLQQFVVARTKLTRQPVGTSLIDRSNVLPRSCLAEVEQSWLEEFRIGLEKLSDE